MDKGKIRNLLLILILMLTYIAHSSAQEGSGSTVAEEATTEATTEAATEGSADGDCTQNEKCTKDCICGNGCSLEGYCADPCDEQFSWCPTGSICSISGSNPYTCDCGPGFYRNRDDRCLPGKFFGGNITFDEVEIDETAVQEILDGIYRNIDFVEAEVLNLASYSSKRLRRADTGPATAEYKLTYKNVESVNEETVKMLFDTKTGCDDKDVYSDDDYIINCTASKDTVVVRDLLCEEPTFIHTCEKNTATCNFDDGGSFFCACREPLEYAKPSPDATYCLEIVCIDNSSCGPFGGICEVDKNNSLSNTCICAWGFEGDNCEQPWMFVFTVVSAGLGLILIALLTACICVTRKSKASPKSTPQEDMDLKNPFMDFQPGVRAKVPSHLYSSVSDSLDATNGGSQSHTNGAYSNTYDETGNKTSTFTEPGRASGNEYF